MLRASAAGPLIVRHRVGHGAGEAATARATRRKPPADGVPGRRDS